MESLIEDFALVFLPVAPITYPYVAEAVATVFEWTVGPIVVDLPHKLSPEAVGANR